METLGNELGGHNPLYEGVTPPIFLKAPFILDLKQIDDIIEELERL